MTTLFVPIAKIDSLITPAAHALTQMTATAGNAKVRQLDIFGGLATAPLVTVDEAAGSDITCPRCRRSAPRPRRGKLYCDGTKFHEVR